MWNELRNRFLPIFGTLEKGALRAALVLAVTVSLLQGCGALVVGGVAAGASVAHERRDSLTVLEDEHTEHSAAQLLIDNPDINQHSRIAITSYNHLVLLTGQAETQAISDRFADKVARLPRVRKVINEVTIGPLASFARESEDALITSRVKIALTEIDIPGFDTTRVKVVTEEGTVYLMGLVYSREGDEAAEKARYVPGVTKVIKVFEYIEP
ncbi:MAG: BON domain-containing protein [Chromatiaceae bacterium]|nr:BON domain-containing protein [Chromatiaceae bacterium]